MFTSSREVAAAIGELIRAKRPQAGYFNYIQEYTDGIMSESNTAVARPLPLWPYSASDRVNRARNSQPGKMAVNLNMQFVDYWWRFATVPRGEIALRCWQNMANGGALTFEVNGTLDLQDRQALETAKPIFRWAAENEQYYCRPVERRARAAAGRSRRIPGGTTRRRPIAACSACSPKSTFRSPSRTTWIGSASGNFDLVIASDWAPAGLRQYAEGGGKVLIASAAKPEFDVARRGADGCRREGLYPGARPRRVSVAEGYRSADAQRPVHDREGDRPALADTGSALDDRSARVHPHRYEGHGHAGHRGRAGRKRDRGVAAVESGALYYRHSLPAHAGLFRDLVDRLTPRRQIRTNAHPLVEMTLMRQGGRTLLHVINLSGHSQTGYFAPVPMQAIRVQVAGIFERQRPFARSGSLAVRAEQGYSEFTIPASGGL